MGEIVMTKMKKLLCLLLALMFVFNFAAVNMGMDGGVSAATTVSLVPGSTLTLDTAKGLIKGLTPNNTAATLAGNFDGSVTVYKANGTAASSSEKISTGYYVLLDGTKYYVVISADISPDSDINATDIVLLKSFVNDVENLGTAIVAAADINADGSVTSADVVSLKSHISGSIDIFSYINGAKYVLTKSVAKYENVADAEEQENSTGTAAAGTYYVYSGYPHGLNGYYNITTDATGKTAGFWINPVDNKTTTTTVATYEVVTSINKYANASDAKNMTNASGKVTAGTYYIYNKYPTGYNGVYNLTTDPTGSAAGFWINPGENVVPTATVYTIVKDINWYSTASDAAAKTNPTGTLTAGNYYIYKNYPNGYNGMFNITTDSTGETAGYWINPDENQIATADTYMLAVDTPKYSSAADAAARTNSTGTATAGTYYIYAGYPDGYNGMYNLTTDPTGEAAGFWINPGQVNTGFVNDDGSVNLNRNINKYSSSNDAANQANITGTADKDTKFYVYKNYPNGVNGVYNITTDPTGATAGFWVNPAESTGTKLNYKTLKGIWISQYEMQLMAISGGSQTTQANYTSKVTRALTQAKQSGFNTVLVQVRPNGDSFYPSSYYPLSKYVVGSYGLTTKFDPLQIFIEQAQELALSVHAWVNPLRLMGTDEISSISSTYKIKQWYNDTSKRGTYIVAHNGTYYLNPGYDDTRNLVIDGVKEICNNYAVDGIHFDDYFYPEGISSSFDQAAFSASGQANLMVFRRACVNALVKGVYNAVKAVDSELIFGISPAGNIYNNVNLLGADVNTWCTIAGYVDYIAPQIYWGFEHSVSPFEDVLAEWETLVAKRNVVKLIVGIDLSHAYGSTDSYDGTEWTDHKDVIARQITTSSGAKNFGGVMLFSMRYYYNVSSGAYVGNLTAERANYEPVLKKLYIVD